MSTAKRTLRPGLGSILFAAQLNLMFSWATPFLNDPGTGWHLRAGRLMLEQKHWIDVDPFSFTHAGEPWLTFEWLSEVIFALVEHTAGLGGLVVFGFCLFALVPLLLLRWLVANEIPYGTALAYAVSALVVFQGHALARPHVFTYLGFLALLLVVGPRAADGPARRHWLALPVLFAWWANVHGGFVAGLLWLAARLVGLAIDRTASPGSLRRWATLFAACAAATLVNPRGIGLHRKILEIVGLHTLRYWQEFAPPDFYLPSLLAAVVLAIVFLLLVGMKAGVLDDLSWEELVPVLVFLHFSFKSQRHVFLLILVASVPICRTICGVLPTWRPRVLDSWSRFAEMQRGARGDWWAMPLLALLFAGLFVASGIPRELRVGEKHLSRGAAEFLSANLYRVRRPLTTTSTGGPLLYYFFPDVRVSFDDRADFYGDRVNARFLGLFELRPRWETVLSEYPFDSAILPPDMPLAVALSLMPEWREAYRDDVVMIFFRG